MAGPVWSLAREPALHVCDWRDEASGIAFDERTGDTFVLGPLAMELLAELGEADGLDAESLVDRVSCSIAPPVPPTLAADVRLELERLHTRGLVACLTS